MDGKRLCFVLSSLFFCTYCIAFENFHLDREIIRKSILQYRAKRSTGLSEEYSPRLRVRRQAFFPTDDEDIAESSGDDDDLTEPEPPIEPDVQSVQNTSEWVWYRSKITFLNSITYSEDLADYHTDAFHSLSDKIMVAVEDHLQSALPGYHEATPLMFTKRPNNSVDVLVDVGACSANSRESVEQAIRTLLRTGQIGNLTVTENGFNMREVGRDSTREECRSTVQPETTTRTTTTTSATEPTPPDPDVDVSVRPRPNTCATQQATCRNGQCIDRSRICDGNRDCADGSDEPPSCGDSAVCDPTEFLCPGTGICVQKMWRCDGDDDCGDGFDELGCPTAPPNSNCRGIEFECLVDSTCVPASYQCDGERDCSDNADEIGCARPVVTRPPRRNVTVKEGDTVVLHCEAVGVPFPIISWRLNWGNVASPPRVSMTSVNGSGELIIKEVRRSDQGAYTCEAINSQGSIFAIPDAILFVEEASDDQPPCPPGQYGMEEGSCRPCYCFGITDQCEPLEMEYDEIGIVFENPDDDGFVELKPAEAEGGDPKPSSEPINKNQILVKPAARELQLIDLSKRFLAAAHYWSLPAQFLGAKINSYGGTLRFSFSYNNSYNFEPKPTNYSDVIIEGANGRTLVYHDKGEHPGPETKHTRNVTLEEDGWTTPAGTPATRKEFLGVINNIDKLLLRTVYDNSMLSTGIGDVRMSVAEGSSSSTSGGNGSSTTSSGHSSGSDKSSMAYDVEKCICPEGYEGLSCQYCAPGWKRITVGPFVGRCTKIEPEPCPTGYIGDDCTSCADGYEKYDGVCLEIGFYRCEPSGTISPGIDGDCECKVNVEGRRCDRCKQGYFDLFADNPDGCRPCFCMGVTLACNSSQLYRYKIVPPYTEDDGFLLTNADSSRRLQDVIRVRQRSGINIVQAQFAADATDIFYWVLPTVFTGDLVKSYGGSFRYTVEYYEQLYSVPVNIADVKIIGDDLTLEHRALFTPREPNLYDIKLTEEYWVHSDGSPTTREELMTTLANVENILVRASYATNSSHDTTIYDISLESARYRTTVSRRATEVEQCLCPPGYQGTSCEICADGYHRSNAGTCVRCSCNGHSDKCDEETGRCIDCQHNTVGSRCDYCAEGFYGDARSGTPVDCRPCPCPLLPSRSDVPKVASCVLDVDGLPTCDECPSGYEGRNCDRCSPGYFPDALRGCSQTGTTCQCDPNGSVGGTCDEEGQCNCKEGVEGVKCDVCKPSYFFFSVENTGGGCLPCFCMGVTNRCESANYVRDSIEADFSVANGGFSLINRQRNQHITDGFQVRSRGTVLTRPNMASLPDDIYYWNLPSEFLGDKVVSYGGDLKYTVSYTDFSSGIAVSQPDVIIVGNDITLVAYLSGDVEARVQTEKTITFRESQWQRTDGQPATREHLLMVLADLELLLIRASYSTSMYEATISDVSMETASANEFDGPDFAYDVEKCECPDGYEGMSCEDCSPGFTRSSSGVYLGICEPCQCNGRAETCDSETGVCENCRDHTVGFKCETCAPGYYSMSDDVSNLYCAPCACPGTYNNSFSDTCEYVISTRQLICDACEEGYEGNRCENCAEGYEGNPRVPGGKCVRKRTPGLPPIVTVTPSSTTVSEGSSVTLRCDARSTTPVQISWRRVGSVRGAPAASPTSDVGSTLTIRQYSSSDAGTYECVATNQYGSDSDTAVVRTAPKSRKMTVRVEEPAYRRLPIGSEVTFVCNAESEMNAYIIYWSKRGGPLPNFRSTEFNGILHITDLREEDSGIYVCTGSNMYDIDRQTAELVVVRESGGEKPSVTITPARQVVREGEEARFECSADGTPPIRIEWQPSPGESLPSNARVINGELYVPIVSTSDSAVFYCRAHNAEGFAEATAVLDVTAAGTAPVVTVVTATTVHIEEGQTIEMRCTATGVPAPLFSWRRVGRARLPDNAEPRGGTLRLVNIRGENQDTYVCTATNAFGQDSGAILLNVTTHTGPEKPICKTDPEFLTAYIGADTSVACIPEGDPLPTVTWVRSDGSPLPSNARIEGNKLVIRSVTMENAGKYMCVATNPGGTTRSEMTLKVDNKTLPEVAILPRNQQVIEVGHSASFTCRATAGHPVEVTWSRTDRKPFTRGTTLEDGGVIRFTNVSQEDGGSYLCIARNVVGFREFPSLLTVIRKPTIMIEPTSDIYLRRGSSITLRCNADGIPVPNVAWQKIHMFDRGIAITHYKRHSNTLHIRADQIGTSAQYMCVAMSAAGDARKKVSVTVGERETVVPPEVTVERTVISSPVGRKVQLRCGGSGYPSPEITWSKRGGELPEGSTQDDSGVLTIANTVEDSAGVYVCEGSNTGGSDNAETTLKIIIAPEVEISPSNPIVYIAAGQSQVLACTASRGTDPITYDFVKASGRMSDNIVSSGGRLEISSFNPDTDSGAYTCTGTNSAGSGNSEVTILPLDAPTVEMSTTELTVFSGENIEIRCDSTGNDGEIIWNKVEGELDLERTTNYNGVLEIRNATTSDIGGYHCSATNNAGTTTELAFVLVLDPPSVIISLSSYQIRIGSRLEISCTAAGNPVPSVTLTKNGGEVLEAENGELVIEQVSQTDSGTYACLAENIAGTARDEIDVDVQAPLMISIIPDVAVLESRSGDELAISCVVKGTDLAVSWAREGGDLPSSATVGDNLLQINRVSTEDAGVYKCSASIEGKTLEQSIKIVVHAFIPYLTQSPTSYMALSGNEDFYRDLAITVSFRPNSEDGLILYSYGSSGDFMSLVLVKGKVEFRYNVGSGDAVIVSNEKVSLNEWHTVTITRDGREGQLTVDKDYPVYGSSGGNFETLDLDQPLYVGGYPASGDSLPEPLRFLGFDVGFYGCISQLNIGGANIEFGASDLIIEKVGILRCKTCGLDQDDSPCQNEASCTESHASSKGYLCDCSDEFVGPECQFRKEDLCGDFGICGDHGSCTPDYERELGYHCDCDPGYIGPKCQYSADERIVEQVPPEEEGDDALSEGIVEGEPTISEATSFSTDSFMKLDVDHGDQTEFDVIMRVKVRSLDDGLIMYNRGVLNRRKREASLDGIFVSLAMRNGSLEFRYNCGSGLATLISAPNVLNVNEWHTIHANRTNRRGVLMVDDVMVAEGQAPKGKGARRAQLDGHLFIGGVRFWDRVPDQVGVAAGLDGCIEGVFLDRRHVSLHVAVSSKNVESCVIAETTTTTSTTATTTTTTTTTTTASTTTPTTTEYFDSSLFINSGIPAGFSGSSARFTGDSFVSYPPETFPHDGAAEQISLYFKTTEPEGLLMIQGRSGGDFVLLGMRSARLEYMFQFGSGQTKVSSSFPLADGRWHNVTIVRRGPLALMWIDDLQFPVAIQAEGETSSNIEIGDVFIGGSLNVPMDTGDRYIQGFRGCVKEVKITSLTSRDAESVGATYFDDSQRQALRFGATEGRKAIKGVSRCRSDKTRTADTFN